ncbi:MAG TPA: biotin/lipoyl-containing protein, partial [Actinopolymorphaceae bacterium]|nr:biotin/lipoyl-containing protein [Actinopolymorphaceae bacterium]
MPVSVTLPALGESVTEGTVTRWLKQVGDSVQADEPLLEVSTDKVDTEIPAPASGTLVQITVGEDETVEVGAELGVIGSDSESAEPSAQQPSQPEESQPEQTQQPKQTQQAEQTEQAQQAQQTESSYQPGHSQQAAEQRERADEPATSAPSGSSNGASTSVTLPALGE